MSLFWLTIVGLILFYYISDKKKQNLSAYKKQSIDIIKSFTTLCRSYPKEMDKLLIYDVETIVTNEITNKTDFDNWLDNQVKKSGSVEIAIYSEINSILGMYCALSSDQQTNTKTKTLIRMEAISHKCLMQAFAKIGKKAPEEGSLIVRKVDTDN